MTAAASAGAAIRQAITMRRAYAETAPAQGDTTATVHAETPNAAFAYAAAPGAPEVGTFRPAGSFGSDRTPATLVTALPDTTIAVKTSPIRPGFGTDRAALNEAVRSGERFEEPWLRLMVVASDARSFLTTALLGPLDFRCLTAFLVKPESAVVMTFGTDPNPGITADRFSGDAVVFMSTMSFRQRTASLR